ncbi:MAG: hypothetical protein V8T10_01295 [Merdibacter sp.]
MDGNTVWRARIDYLDGNGLPFNSDSRGGADCLRSGYVYQGRNGGKSREKSLDERYEGAINTAAVRDEGTTIHYIPIEYPAVADRHVVEALSTAAKNNGLKYIEGNNAV